jgi:PAS domain S-box-containing protein
LLDHTNDAIEVIDPETGRFVDVNEQACRVHGYDREAYLTLTVADVDPKVTEREWPGLVEDMKGLGSRVFEAVRRRRDGSFLPVEINVSYIELDRAYLLAVVRDITERKRSERALLESHSLLNAVVEGTSDAIFVKDLEGRYLMINTSGARFIGKTVEEVIGKDDLALSSAETAREMMKRDREVMTHPGPRTYEETGTAAGTTRTYLTTKEAYRDARGDVIGLIGIARDITDLKRLEEQFRQSQKMEAIGRLAGGVAHDFNNLLTVINGYSEIVLTELATDHPSRALLIEIRKAGERAANLTRQLLAFSRRQVLHAQVVSVNQLLSETRRLLLPLIGENIELVSELHPELGAVKVDPGQFEHAVINLAVNARDAMPAGGRLWIQTRLVTRSESEGGARDAPRDYALIIVRDTGHGMAASTLARVFEPFFTTKPPGKGTGLGLAMVYGFVKQSGGFVEVESAPDQGTAVKMYLPIAAEGAPTKTPSLVPEMPMGSETILLVEDEDAVRQLSKLVLESSGYTVIEAKDGKEALELAEWHSGTLDLLVTDLVMPKIGGQELAARLLPSHPRLYVLFVSGYPDEDAASAEGLGPRAAFLQKPYSPAALSSRVRELLDAAREEKS